LEKEGKVKKSAILWSTIWIIVQSILALFVTPNFLQCMYNVINERHNRLKHLVFRVKLTIYSSFPKSRTSENLLEFIKQLAENWATSNEKVM
jgi:hypothetical protein